jgi:hypothetical protein
MDFSRMRLAEKNVWMESGMEIANVDKEEETIVESTSWMCWHHCDELGSGNVSDDVASHCC